MVQARSVRQHLASLGDTTVCGCWAPGVVKALPSQNTPTKCSFWLESTTTTTSDEPSLILRKWDTFGESPGPTPSVADSDSSAHYSTVTLARTESTFARTLADPCNESHKSVRCHTKGLGGTARSPACPCIYLFQSACSTVTLQLDRINFSSLSHLKINLIDREGDPD